jgi:hypothetical protein
LEEALTRPSAVGEAIEETLHVIDAARVFDASVDLVTAGFGCAVAAFRAVRRAIPSPANAAVALSAAALRRIEAARAVGLTRAAAYPSDTREAAAFLRLEAAGAVWLALPPDADIAAANAAAALSGAVAEASVRLAIPARQIANRLHFIDAETIPGVLAAERIDVANLRDARRAERLESAALHARVVRACQATADVVVANSAAALHRREAHEAVGLTAAAAHAAIAGAAAAIER